MKTALLSVYDKTGIADFARNLTELGWNILSSGGTAKTLRDAGITVRDVSSLVGGGAILGHRVVTLSREIHAGLLARDTLEDQAELDRLGIPRIDLVCVDLYPLKQAIEKPDSTLESVIEMTDIGGPTLLRSAAKGRRIVICGAEQRNNVIAWLQEGEPDRENVLRQLAAAAEFVVARYCMDSARYHSQGGFDGIMGWKLFELKYGENPYMKPAALFATGDKNPLGFSHSGQIAGTKPSFVNITDVDRLLQTITHIAAGFDVNFGEKPAIALCVKHGNCCGAGVSEDGWPLEAIQKMATGDDLAAFGGIVMVSFPIRAQEAEVLLHFGRNDNDGRKFDTVVAPEISAEAAEMLSRKGGKCRMLVIPALGRLSRESLDSDPRLRPVTDGFLRQPNYTFILNLCDPQLTYYGELTEQQKRDAVLAWAIGSTSNSNTITIVYDHQLIGNGVGQQARVYAAKLAVERARTGKHEGRLAYASAYSDSFFPHEDAVETLAEAGVKFILTSSGSLADKRVMARAKELGVTLLMISDKIGRGFYGH